LEALAVVTLTLGRLPPYPSDALAFGAAPAALQIGSPVVSAVQFPHLVQIISADVVPNIAPDDIPTHAFSGIHSSASPWITVNRSSAMSDITSSKTCSQNLEAVTMDTSGSATAIWTEMPGLNPLINTSP
jgi:hypothetical protein